MPPSPQPTNANGRLALKAAAEAKILGRDPGVNATRPFASPGFLRLQRNRLPLISVPDRPTMIECGSKLEGL